MDRSDIQFRGITAAASGIRNPWCKHCRRPLVVGPNGWKTTTYTCWSATEYGPHVAVEADAAMEAAILRGHVGRFDSGAKRAEAANT